MNSCTNLLLKIHCHDELKKKNDVHVKPRTTVIIITVLQLNSKERSDILTNLHFDAKKLFFGQNKNNNKRSIVASKIIFWIGFTRPNTTPKVLHTIRLFRSAWRISNKIRIFKS